MDYNFITELDETGDRCGSKAREDIDVALRHYFGEPYYVYRRKKFTSFYDKVKYVLNNCVGFARLFNCHGKNIIMQYPYCTNRILEELLVRLSKHNKVTLIVHDIDSIRGLNGRVFSKEIAYFNTCQNLVLHNESMIKYLVKNGLKTKTINLEIFDYFLKERPNKHYSPVSQIAFAGNLSKSVFLQDKELEKVNAKFILFGSGYSRELFKANNIDFKGIYTEEEIPYKLEGGFGLVWDGNSIDTCSGDIGEYTKYNNPYKLSLYIAAGLPVIAWKKAAIAKLIEKYNIGFTVDSLQDINTYLHTLSPEKYNCYLENIKTMQLQVCTGTYINKAISKLVAQND